MLSQRTPVATLATADLARARVFYEETLGLAAAGENVAGVLYTCGDGSIFVYQSDFAGSNAATAVTFNVPVVEFDDEVEALRGKDVRFMTFDLPGLDWTDGVASGEGMRAVWFADPDGNIINVSSGDM